MRKKKDSRSSSHVKREQSEREVLEEAVEARLTEKLLLKSDDRWEESPNEIVHSPHDPSTPSFFVTTDEGMKTSMAVGEITISGVRMTVVATSKCCPTDTYDYDLGRTIALARACREMAESLEDQAVARASVLGIDVKHEDIDIYA